MSSNIGRQPKGNGHLSQHPDLELEKLLDLLANKAANPTVGSDVGLAASQ